MKQQLNEWLDSIIVDLKANYNQMGLKASGNWEKEVEQKITETQSGYNLKVLGAKYTDQLQNGRKPNKNQENIKGFAAWASKKGSGFIYNWCKDKGINTIYAFPIALKIAKHGWQVPNRYNKGGLVSDVINEKKIEGLKKSLSTYVIENLRSEAIKTWQSRA